MSKERNRTKRKLSSPYQLLKALHPDAIFNRFSKIRNKIFSLTFLLLLIFGVIGLIVFQALSMLYEEKIYEESAQNLNLSSHVIDEELKKIEELAFQISTDSFTQNRMEQLKNDNFSFQAYRTQQDLLERMTVYVHQEPYISSVQIIEASGKVLQVGRTSQDPDDLKAKLDIINKAEGGNVWLTAEGNQMLLSALEIRQKDKLSLEHLGYLIISINLDDFIDKTLSFSFNNQFIITKEDELIYQDQFKADEVKNIFQLKMDNGYHIIPIGGEEYFVTNKESEFSDMTYYNMRPFENIVSTKQLITRLMIGYFIFVLFLTMFLSRKSARAISKPIEKLTAKMKQVQNGNFDPVDEQEESYLKDEIGDLQRNFYIMLDKINELIKENFTKQLLIKETEYKALQSQINPHFLYNTLDSINWLAKMNDQPKISSMVEALGNMMRNIISKKAPLISLKEELEIINHYITIQKYRYGDRLHFDLQYDPALETASIPKLTIQPLVENAIQHGLEEMEASCYINVHVSYEEDLLLIMVRDNGPGMDEQTIQQIYQGNIKPKGSGIGLYNIKERIELMFGKEHGVRIASEPGSGTSVKIALPFTEH
ncbi:cache domain-containing sensor histidine kinase [Sediminibacillus massiliensis]|uniref:cache domain-containing sensor histidine kinase n=1 Tax=Sediminibacillus massiliensis TaxID=1926277 RepID=UPI00098873EF|nr:sensor histidine kinase [Sediminibacillus massiliensis]